MMLRFALAAAGLLLYAVGLLAVALSLPHVGRWTIGAGALLLLAQAAGLWMHRRGSWAFGITFYGLTGLAYVVLAPVIFWWGYRAFADHSLVDLVEGLAFLVAAIAVGGVMASTPILFLLGVGSGLLAWALLRGRDGLECASGFDSPLAAIFVVIASFALLAWNGFEYFPRDLPGRNACAGGSKDACEKLSYSGHPFSVDETREFMRRGCQLGSYSTCVSLLGEKPSQRSVTQADIGEAAAACRAARLDVCKALAEHLLAAGDVQTATGHLSFACNRSPPFCADAAELLRERGQPVLASTFHSAGCDNGHARSCRALLEQKKGLPDQERRRLELRGCLQGSDDVCDELIARDFPEGCDQVCRLADARAAYVCFNCARRATLLGDAARAKTWLDLSCAQGLKAACREAAGPAGAAPSPPQAQPGPSSAPVAQAVRTRIEALMPEGCKLLDARQEQGVTTITGLADSTSRVSAALRAFNDLGAQPRLLDIHAEGDRYRFRASLTTAALAAR